MLFTWKTNDVILTLATQPFDQTNATDWRQVTKHLVKRRIHEIIMDEYWEKLSG